MIWRKNRGLWRQVALGLASSSSNLLAKWPYRYYLIALGLSIHLQNRNTYFYHAELWSRCFGGCHTQGASCVLHVIRDDGREGCYLQELKGGVLKWRTEFSVLNTEKLRCIVVKRLSTVDGTGVHGDLGRWRGKAGLVGELPVQLRRALGLEGPHSWLMLCCRHLERLNDVLTRGLAFSFCTGPCVLRSQSWNLGRKFSAICMLAQIYGKECGGITLPYNKNRY